VQNLFGPEKFAMSCPSLGLAMWAGFPLLPVLPRTSGKLDPIHPIKIVLLEAQQLASSVVLPEAIQKLVAQSDAAQDKRNAELG
jgi:hypothetical protein